MTQYTWHLPDPETQAEFYQDVDTKRLVAFGIDTVVTLVITLFVVLLSGFLGFLVFPMLWIGVNFIYRYLQISAKSATWGMRIMAIELRDSSGHLLDGQTAALHTAGFCLSLSVPFIQVISIIMMANDARGQGLCDQFLGTVMINRRAGN